MGIMVSDTPWMKKDPRFTEVKVSSEEIEHAFEKVLEYNANAILGYSTVSKYVYIGEEPRSWQSMLVIENNLRIKDGKISGNWVSIPGPEVQPGLPSAYRILTALLTPARDREEIVGDMIERYEKDTVVFGVFWANVIHGWDITGSLASILWTRLRISKWILGTVSLMAALFQLYRLFWGS